MSRSTPLGALRRDEELDPNTRDMVDGIVNELEPQGLPGGGYPPQYEDMNGQMGPTQMMDYGAPPDGGMYPSGGGYPPEFSGGNSNMLPPGDPRNGQMQMHPQEYSPQNPQNSQNIHNPNQYPQNPQNSHNRGFANGISEYVINNSREPMLAAALFLVMSNDTISTLLSRYIPYAGSPLLGLLIRAILVAGLFFVAKTFVLKR